MCIELKSIDRKIGSGHPCFVIAEVGVNHNGNAATAQQLIEAAFDAGADAVKFQTFQPEQLATPHSPKAEYQRERTTDSESQLDMLQRLNLPFPIQGELQAYCAELGIEFLSTPFEEESANFLQKLDVPLIKMASGELTNHPLLAHVARFGKPLVVSTGMANLNEVEAAMQIIAANGAPPVALLHCVSQYPAQPSGSNLLAMQTMSQTFKVPIGFSDHSVGCEVALAAVALGACIIEKHLTLDRELPGPDHHASMEPDEFKAMITSIRLAETTLGDGMKCPTAGELAVASVSRKSLVASKPIAAGELLSEDNIAVRRPGTGLAPAMKEKVLGCRTRTELTPGTPVKSEDLE